MLKLRQDMCIFQGNTFDILFDRAMSSPPKRSFLSPVSTFVREGCRCRTEGHFSSVAILGPVRNATQVEISATDARMLGIEAPVKESGDTAGSAGCKIVGPKGEVEISEGVIIAKRHIHLDPETAEKFGVKDKQIVNVNC